MHTILHRFDYYTFAAVRQHPMQLSRRHVLCEACVGKSYSLKQVFCFTDGRAFSQKPRYQFKLRYIKRSAARLLISCVSDKVKPCNTKSFFIHRIIKKRITAAYVSHARYRIMLRQVLRHTHFKQIIPRHNCYAFPV